MSLNHDFYINYYLIILTRHFIMAIFLYICQSTEIIRKTYMQNIIGLNEFKNLQD